jgi:MFS superfamily sulfate permease-like transporter
MKAQAHSKESNELTFKFLKNDLPAGLVVFLVALPLCLGIALASGAPLFSGLIAGIVGGTVVAFLSNSPLSVSGPAAGLTVIVLHAITDLGGYETFLLAVVLAGMLQVALGYMKAGIIGYYFPSSVIKGMLAGIGIILIIKQIPHALGYQTGTLHTLGVNEAAGFDIFKGLAKHVGRMHPGAIIISAVSLFILILWDRPYVKKYTFFKIVPGALLLVIAGIAINQLFKTSFPAYYLDNNKLVQLPVAVSASGFLHQFTLPDFTALGNYKLYVVAVTIAIIASLESLLSVEAVDKLDPYKRNTDANRELKAQGIGNIISGLIGGLPITAVIVRSAANITAGGKTKVSAIFHGLLLLASVVGLAKLLNQIPLACLAALLLMVGYKLAKVSLFTSMYKLGIQQFLPFVVTVIAIQFSDLLKGIAIGMGVAVFFILRDNYNSSFSYHKTKENDDETVVIQLAEEISFLNKGNIAKALGRLSANSKVVIDGSRSNTIDLDVLETIYDFKKSATLKNISVELKKIPEYNGVSGH